MFKIIQARVQEYMNCELPDVQVGFRKGKGTRDHIANMHWIIEKRIPEKKKNLLLLYWLHQNLWPYSSQQTTQNSSRDGNTRSPDLPPKKSMQVKKQQLQLDMGQQTLQIEKEYVKAVYCHPAYVTYMQSTS